MNINKIKRNKIKMFTYEIKEANVDWEHHHVNLKGEREINVPDARELKIVEVLGVPVLYISLIRNENVAAHAYEYDEEKGKILRMKENSEDLDRLCEENGWLNMNGRNNRCERNLRVLM